MTPSVTLQTSPQYAYSPYNMQDRPLTGIIFVADFFPPKPGGRTKRTAFVKISWRSFHRRMARRIQYALPVFEKVSFGNCPGGCATLGVIRYQVCIYCRYDASMCSCFEETHHSMAVPHLLSIFNAEAGCRFLSPYCTYSRDRMLFYLTSKFRHLLLLTTHVGYNTVLKSTKRTPLHGTNVSRQKNTHRRRRRTK